MRRFLCAGLMLLIATAAGCSNIQDGQGSAGGGDGGGEDTAGPSEGSGSTTSLRVVNDSSQTIWYLYVSPSSIGTWGPDQLGAHVVAPGASFTLRNMPCGRSYDLKAEGSGHRTLATHFSAYFTCGQTKVWNLYSGG